MKPSIVFREHREAIREILSRHHVVNGRVFGSVASGSDREGSDLDLLVEPTARTTLMDIGAIRQELLDLLGVPVDVVTPGALPEHIRTRVLKTAEPV